MAKRKNSGPPAIVVKEMMGTSGDKYEVRISRNDGKLYCTCKGWGFKKTCRHTEATDREEILAALANACKTGVLGI